MLDLHALQPIPPTLFSTFANSSLVRDVSHPRVSRLISSALFSSFSVSSVVSSSIRISEILFPGLLSTSLVS